MELIKKYGKLTGEQKYNVFIISFFSGVIYVCIVGPIIQQTMKENPILQLIIILGGALVIVTIATFLWIKHEKIKGEDKNRS